MSVISIRGEFWRVRRDVFRIHSRFYGKARPRAGQAVRLPPVAEILVGIVLSYFYGKARRHEVHEEL